MEQSKIVELLWEKAKQANKWLEEFLIEVEKVKTEYAEEKEQARINGWKKDVDAPKES